MSNPEVNTPESINSEMIVPYGNSGICQFMFHCDNCNADYIYVLRFNVPYPIFCLSCRTLLTFI